MALTPEHFKRIRAAEIELKAAYAAAAAELSESQGIVAIEGATSSTWVRIGNRFKEVSMAEPVRVS